MNIALLDRPKVADEYDSLAGAFNAHVALRDGQCRFPIGLPRSPDFHFCDGNAVEGSPYCAHHTRTCSGGLPIRKR